MFQLLHTDVTLFSQKLDEYLSPDTPPSKLILSEKSSYLCGEITKTIHCEGHIQRGTGFQQRGV